MFTHPAESPRAGAGEGVPLFTCCGPLLTLAWLANTATRGFFTSASASMVARHWFCALSAIFMYRSVASRL